MLTRSCAQSQVENDRYQLKIIKTYEFVRVLRQGLIFLILETCLDPEKSLGFGWQNTNFFGKNLIHFECLTHPT